MSCTYVLPNAVTVSALDTKGVMMVTCGIRFKTSRDEVYGSR